MDKTRVCVPMTDYELELLQAIRDPAFACEVLAAAGEDLSHMVELVDDGPTQKALLAVETLCKTIIVHMVSHDKNLLDVLASGKKSHSEQ